jgi:thiosulfate reductase cytochrome b subunit
MAAIEVDKPAETTRTGHAVWVRLCHWVLAASVLTLAYSGVVILMAHPRLYWGETGNDLTRAWIELPLGRNYMHGGWAAPLRFFSDAGPVSRVRTYDIFNQNGWARSLHFLFAWLFAAALGLYLAIGLASGHLRRTVVPSAGELAPSHLAADLAAHLHLPLPRRPAGPPYNLLQKLAYAGVVVIALPVMVLSGLAMSPAVNAAWPMLGAMFGGTQSARSIHFLFLCALALFLAVHLTMVILTGFWRQLRAITWGR